jgi:2-oxo-hept-3-ene-1,7-dioate hydratase
MKERGMTPKDHRAAALALLDAEATRRQIGLLSLTHPGMTLDDAYAVQADLVALKLAGGRHRVGWKIGLTSRAMQEALNIDTPDSGVLLDDMLSSAMARPFRKTVSSSRGSRPRSPS